MNAIGKIPIVVNDSRGFFTSRVCGAFISEGHRLLKEGVPAAMIENCAKFAGMPVGPLSLNDEVAIDLSWKIMDQTRRDAEAAMATDVPFACTRRTITGTVPGHLRKVTSSRSTARKSRSSRPLRVRVTSTTDIWAGPSTGTP